MGKLSSYNRNEILKLMKDRYFDVIVIGGGITGAGIALDAASRGMRTALVDMQDFAAGTSSRSTKLVHGGLRYLQQFEVKMVAEIGRERAIVYENGPHVTTPEWMLLPFYKESNLGALTIRIGLTIYDWLAGVKKAERRKMLSPKEALAMEPLLKSADLKGAGYYVEYKTDDARLTLEIIKKAADYDAQVLNYVKAIGFLYDEKERIKGIKVKDMITGEIIEIKGKKVVNAAGPWVDSVMEMDKSKTEKTLLHTKGVHLVFDQSVFPLRQAIYFDGPDHRMIFAIPRAGKSYIGTTDTIYEGDLVTPLVMKEDRDYLLDAIHFMFPGLELGEEAVESSWAGLRPLIAEGGKKLPSEISRKDEIIVSDTGLISIAGGKLTGYRKMAEQVIDKVAELFKKEEGILYSDSAAKTIRISGGHADGSAGFKKYSKIKIKEGITLGLTEGESAWLVRTYGINADKLFQIYERKRAEADEYSIDPVLFAALIYAIESEAAYKPVDFLVRRTGALFFRIDLARKYSSQIANYMAEKLEWTMEEKKQYIYEMEEMLKRAAVFD